jgi:hypothetical protein
MCVGKLRDRRTAQETSTKPNVRTESDMEIARPRRQPRTARVAGLGPAAALVVAASAFAHDNTYSKPDCDGTEAIALVNGKIHTMDAKNNVVS